MFQLGNHCVHPPVVPLFFLYQMHSQFVCDVEVMINGFIA